LLRTRRGPARQENRSTGHGHGSSSTKPCNARCAAHRMLQR